MKYELWNKNLHGYSTTNLFLFINAWLFSLLFVIHIWETEMNKTEEGTAEKSEASYKRKSWEKRRQREKEKLTKWKEKIWTEKMKMNGMTRGVMSYEKLHAPNKLKPWK